jgi:hypothetical protein
MGAAYSHHWWIERRFRSVAWIAASPRRLAAGVGIATGLVAFDIGVHAVRASDSGATRSSARIASASPDPTAPPVRHGTRNSVANGEKESTRDSTAAANPGSREVLATFALSSPESVEEEVAKELGLQLVERSQAFDLGYRIVRYRVPDDGKIAGVIARLRADPRVGKAQANVQYTLPEEHPPPTAVSDLKERTGEAAGERQGPASRRTVAAPTSPKKAQRKLGGPATAAEIVAAAEGGRKQGSRHKGPLASGGHAALRWPTADEPFVNVGAASR